MLSIKVFVEVPLQIWSENTNNIDKGFDSTPTNIIVICYITYRVMHVFKFCVVKAKAYR